MSNNDNQKKTSFPEGLSSIADDEAITEINLTDFLEESSKASPLFEGFHEDIEKTEKSLENELQSLYDDIMSSGPETIVPKPMSVLTASEAEPPKVILSDPEIPGEPENASLDELWMNPEDYFDDDIPVVSLDDGDDGAQKNFIEGEIPSDAFFEPSAVEEFAAISTEDKAKSDIFSMIDLLKSENDKETGFNDILSEIESNRGIVPVETELSIASQLVSEPESYDEPEEESREELSFINEDFDWDDLEFTDEETEDINVEPVLPEITQPTENFEVAEATDESPVEDIPEFITPEADISADLPDPESDFDIPAQFESVADDLQAEDISIEADDFYFEGNREADTSAASDGAGSSFDMEFPGFSAEHNETEKSAKFVIDIPDDEADNNINPVMTGETLYVSAPMSTQTLEDDPDLAESKKEAEKKSKKKNKESKKEKKAKPTGEDSESKGGAGEVFRKIILSLSIITIFVSCGILVNTYFIEPYRFKSDSDALVEQMNVNINEHEGSATVNSQIQNDHPDVDFPDGMLAKYAQLYAQNTDFAGWITIEGLGINLPIAQGDNNEYYLKRDIYKKYTSYGVPFFDYRISDLKNLNKNTMVYGHNMRHDDYIFGMLENYRTIEGFAQAPVIECNTIFGDHTWFVYGVYITNSTPEGDNGYFMPYNFVDISNARFAEYIKEIDKRKLYTTGVDINENDKILTLQACVYDFDGAMIIVVAREKREGESISVDTSKAYYNPNPKYPQAWYDANKKTNPYAEDARW